MVAGGSTGLRLRKASGQERNKWHEFVSDYLVNRDNLSCVFVLIDSRLEPQRIDLEFTAWLVECGVPFVLVFTKADKTKPGVMKSNMDAFLAAMGEFCEGLPRYFTCSAKTSAGRREVLHFIGEANAMG